MTRYANGANFERKVKKDLEGLGWHVTKSGGSRGIVDLKASAPGGEQAWVQCKRDGMLSKKDWQILYGLASVYQMVTPVMAYKGADGGIEYRELVLKVTDTGHQCRFDIWYPGGI